ncbi:MAG: type III secretion protein [Deltaproteobacteria bacterium]|nr:MAG: type III secretion protein [Deltaproteobacteria bacterium]
MINVNIVDYNLLLAFWFAFTRFLAITMQLPLFDNVAIPTLVKILTCLIMTYAFFPGISGGLLSDIAYVGDNSFWILTLFNAFVGITVGLLVKLIMNLFVGAGSVITQQIGFGMVRYFDPTFSQQLGPFEQLISWVILIMVLTSGALFPMFKGLLATFDSITILNINKLIAMPSFFNEFFKSVFLSSLMLASPLIFTNLIIMAILGIIARMVPQMNVLMVSFIVNIWLGLLVFWACSSEFFQVAFRLYTEQLGVWFKFLM